MGVPACWGEKGLKKLADDGLNCRSRRWRGQMLSMAFERPPQSGSGQVTAQCSGLELMRSLHCEQSLQTTRSCVAEMCPTGSRDARSNDLTRKS